MIVIKALNCKFRFEWRQFADKFTIVSILVF